MPSLTTVTLTKLCAFKYKKTLHTKSSSLSPPSFLDITPALEQYLRSILSFIHNSKPIRSSQSTTLSHPLHYIYTYHIHNPYQTSYSRSRLCLTLPHDPLTITKSTSFLFYSSHSIFSRESTTIRSTFFVCSIPPLRRFHSPFSITTYQDSSPPIHTLSQSYSKRGIV